MEVNGNLGRGFMTHRFRVWIDTGRTSLLLSSVETSGALGRAPNTVHPEYGCK
jgi:hypothetical protein